MLANPTTSNPYSLSKNQRSLAGALCGWEGLLQKHFHDSVEAQTVMFFLHIAAQSEPVDMTSVGNALGLSKAAGSRNYYRLSIGIRGGAEGLGLLQYQSDPMDIRRKLLTITPKGIEVVKDLTEFIFKQVASINHN